jgi:hypothetical protein
MLSAHNFSPHLKITYSQMARDDFAKSWPPQIRSWAVAGFEVIRLYFRLEGERNVRRLLGLRTQS